MERKKKFNLIEKSTLAHIKYFIEPFGILCIYAKTFTKKTLDPAYAGLSLSIVVNIYNFPHKKNWNLKIKGLELSKIFPENKKFYLTNHNKFFKKTLKKF